MRIEVNNTVQALNNGETILYPTDTIWGIGCDACNKEAVKKIYKLKQRDASRSMLILVSDIFMAQRYLNDLPDIAIQLFECSDKPLTLILDNAKYLADNIMAPDGSIGIRIPEDGFCQEVLMRFRKPVVSTSANLSGDDTAYCFDEINPLLIERSDYVVNWRQEEGPSKKASSIIRVSQSGEIRIIRK